MNEPGNIAEPPLQSVSQTVTPTSFAGPVHHPSDRMPSGSSPQPEACFHVMMRVTQQRTKLNGEWGLGPEKRPTLSPEMVLCVRRAWQNPDLPCLVPTGGMKSGCFHCRKQETKGQSPGVPGPRKQRGGWAELSSGVASPPQSHPALLSPPHTPHS